MIVFLMVRVTFGINYMFFESSFIVSVQGQSNVTAIRFFPASLPDLGKPPHKSDASLDYLDLI
jgi:hypothetical protein